MGNNVVMFPTHKVRKPKTDLAVKQTEEQAKKIKEDIILLTKFHQSSQTSLTCPFPKDKWRVPNPSGNKS